MNDIEMIKKLENEEGFIKNNNIKYVSISENSCELRMNIDKKILNPYGIVHGGAIFGLGDTVMGMTTRIFKRKSVTLNASINYLKPGTGNYLIAKSEIIKRGKNVCILRANIYNDTDTLIAVMDGTYFYIN